jgi:hypothetical protein
VNAALEGDAVADVDEILARLERLERLERENHELRRLVGSPNAGAAVDASGAGQATVIGRRGLLRRAGAGAVALGAATVGASVAALATAPAVLADGEPITVGGTFTEAHTVTTIRNHVSDDDVFFASSSGNGIGVHGYSEKHDGVYGDTISGNGVHGVAHSDSVGAGV